MFSTTDTIVAIATPAGRGAIGVVRLSGPDAQAVAIGLLGRSAPLLPRRATTATLTAGVVHDTVVATSFPAPSSYTGDDVVEISAHGSQAVLTAIVEAACRAGARLAAPGEFTLRAFLNGKIDLAQAEAVADLIESVTPLQARVAFDQLNGTLSAAIGAIESGLFDLRARLEASVDFPDEGYRFIQPVEIVESVAAAIASIDRLLATASRGRIVREGLQVVLVGRPNAGKSSLFNALVGSRRAIVSPTPGTTRDLVTEVVDIGGLRVTLVDTAGVAVSDDSVEAEGIERAIGAAGAADLVLLVCDGSLPFDEETQARVIDRPHVVVCSKSDLPQVWSREGMVSVSTVTGSGVDDLARRIALRFDGEEDVDRVAVSNVRHARLLDDARTSLRHAADAAMEGLSEEFVLADIESARVALEQVSGQRSTDDLLVHVFSRFCVGK